MGTGSGELSAGAGDSPAGADSRFPRPIPLPSRAGNGTRTRDPNLGKVVLYQLSYSRVYPWHRDGDEGNRTPDLLNAIQALSQLSYAPVRCPVQRHSQETASLSRGIGVVKEIRAGANGKGQYLAAPADHSRARVAATPSRLAPVSAHMVLAAFP